MCNFLDILLCYNLIFVYFYNIPDLYQRFVDIFEPKYVLFCRFES